MPIKYIRPLDDQTLRAIKLKESEKSPTLTPAEVEKQREGIEADPFMDPTAAISSGAGFAATRAAQAGAKLGPIFLRSFAGGAAGGLTEIPVGAATEFVAEDHPQLALPLNIILGIVAGSTVEKRIEDIAETVGKTAIKKAPEKIIKQAELPKYAGSVNLQRQLISEEAKRIEVDWWDNYGIKTPKARAQTIEEAEEIILDFQKNPNKYAQRLADIESGFTPTRSEELAHRIINARDMEKFKEISQEFLNGKVSKETMDATEQQIKNRYLNIAQPLAHAAGGRLSDYNILVGQNKAMKALANLKKGMNKRQTKLFAETDFDDPASIQNFLRELPDPKFRDYFYEYWYNSILSGIPTHVVNTVSNTLWTAFQIPHRLLSTAVENSIATLKGKAKEKYFNETVPFLAGLGKGAKRGISPTWDVIRYNKIQEAESKWAQEIGFALGAWERSNNKVLRGVGHAITIPTKALRAMDVMANSIGYQAELQAYARRVANKKGLKGLNRKRFEQNFLREPPLEAHKAALEFGKYITFMSDPGKISSRIIQMREDVPGGRLLIPFVNTIGNLLKRGVEMTPGVGVLLRKGQKTEEIIAKQIEGLIIGTYVWQKFDAGEITGAPPKTKAERDAFYRQGKKPWSIRVGDKWVEYRRVEPFNTVMATVTSVRENYANAKDDDTKADILFNMANDIKNNFLDSSYLQGVSGLMNRYGEFKKAPPRMAASLVPYSGFWRSINRAYEVATEGSAKVREGNDWINAFSQVIPGLSGKMPARLTVWGKEVELEGGVFRQWLPYRWATEKKDITEESLEKLGVYPGLPSKKYKRGREEGTFDDDIYRDMIIFAGNRMKEKLDKYFSSERRQKLLENEKHHENIKKDIDYIIRTERNYARSKAISKQHQKGKMKQEKPKIIFLRDLTEPKQLDEPTARQILEEAGGDANKAREIARQRGFSF